MSYLHEGYYHEGLMGHENLFRYNNESMLGPISEPNTNTRAVAVGEEFDPVLDANINALLDGLEEDLYSEPKLKYNKIQDNESDDEKKQRDDYDYDYSDEQPDNDDEDSVQLPSWYNDLLRKKIEESKSRLSALSSMVFMVCPCTSDIIRSIERDHNTPFCKLDHPRHPSLKKPWTNYWRFNCVTRCKEEEKDSTCETHFHTSDCQIVVLEHVGTSTTTQSDNVLQCEFPDFLMQTVKLFQKFVNTKSKGGFTRGYVSDSNSEKATWSYIKIRSNYKNEIQLTVAGKEIKTVLGHLTDYFFKGPGKKSNVISLYCINLRSTPKKCKNVPPDFLGGYRKLKDKVGPLTINYTPRTSINFNSEEVLQLSSIMTELLAPTQETTIMDIGCGFGALSLMMSNKCDKVIGLSSLPFEIDAAQVVNSENGIQNATFITCAAKNVLDKCTPLVKKCMTVAMFNLATPYGKSHYVYRALRALPSVWRIVIYGTYTKEFYKLITTLVTKDDSMGDEFLPMRGCVLDKFPSIANAFDIAVLFERKSLIEPSIEFPSCDGPTVNIKGDWDAKDSHPVLKEEFGKFKNTALKGTVLNPKLEKSPEIIKREKPFLDHGESMTKLNVMEAPDKLLSRSTPVDTVYSKPLPDKSGIKKEKFWHVEQSASLQGSSEVTANRENKQPIRMRIVRVKAEPPSPRKKINHDSPVKIKRGIFVPIKNEPTSPPAETNDHNAVQLVNAKRELFVPIKSEPHSPPAVTNDHDAVPLVNVKREFVPIKNEPISSPDASVPRSPLPNNQLILGKEANPTAAVVTVKRENDSPSSPSQFRGKHRTSSSSSWTAKRSPSRNYRSRWTDYSGRSPSSSYSSVSSKTYERRRRSPTSADDKHKFKYRERTSRSPTPRRRKRSSPSSPVSRRYRARSRSSLSRRDSSEDRKERRRSRTKMRKDSSSDQDSAKDEERKQKKKRDKEFKRKIKKEEKREKRFDYWDIPTLSTLSNDSL